MAGFSEIRPVLRPGLMLAVFATIGTAVITALRGRLALRPVDARGPPARIDPGRHRRRRHLRPAAHLHPPAPPGPNARGGGGVQRPGRDPARARVHRLDRGARATACSTWPACSSSRSRSGWRPAWAWASPRCGPCAACRSPPAASTRWRRWPRRALAFGAADSLHGSGFLAIYLAGLVLGSSQIPARNTITVFHQGLAWVAQIGLFLTLGLLVFPSELGDVWLEGTVLALVLVLVARPLAAAVATAFDNFSAAERFALGWAGLRGGVPVVLATFPVIESVPNSRQVLQHHVLRGRGLHDPPGLDLRAPGQVARAHHGRAGAAAPDRRERHDPEARGRGGGVPGGGQRRRGGPLRARPRACPATPC